MNTAHDLRGKEIDDPEIAKWDRAFTKLVINAVTPVVTVWFRPEGQGRLSAAGADGHRAQFGRNADVHEIDAHVRSVMQTALDGLGRQRRFPVPG